jgi:hypothetical protein
VSPATVGLTEDAWEFVTLPAFHLLVVALPGTPLRFVAGPVQATAEQTADVFGVILDAEVPLDEESHPSGRPQFIGETVGRCPLQEKLFQFGQLGVRESAFGPGGRFGGEAVSLASHLSPAV